MRRVLAALCLVGTVLLCQGLYGALHKFSAADLPGAGYSSTIAAGQSGDHSGGDMGAWSCAAAILVVFLGAGSLLLHQGARIWQRFIASLLSDKSFAPRVFHLPRGPTAASRLQVFRL